MTEDNRLTAARDYANGRVIQTQPVQMINDLVAFAEERLRVNVGLLAENETLKKRLAETNPAKVDLTNVDDAEMLTELADRGLLTVSRS